MNLFRWLAPLLALSLSLIAGCASMPSGEPSAELNDKSKGVIVASITSNRGRQTHDAWFFIRKRGEKDSSNHVRLAASGWSPIKKHNDFPALKGRTGRLLAVALEPGEYELYQWQLYIQTMGGYGYISPKAEPPALPFTVSAGQVTYLGYLHLETLMGKNVFGLQIPGGGMPDVFDQSDRDLPLLQTKFPMLSGWPVNKANLNGGLWKASP